MELKYKKSPKGSEIFYFVDALGKKSEKFAYAEDFHDGFALVQKRVDGPYQFMDEEGKLSEEYFSALSYEQGYAVVAKNDGDLLQFRNKKGKLSTEKFICVMPFVEGFWTVIKEGERFYQFRDLLGRITPHPSSVGQEFYNFMMGGISEDNMLAMYPDDKVLIRAIKKELARLERIKKENMCGQHEV